MNSLQAVQTQLASAIGGGDLLAALESAAAFLGPAMEAGSLMITLRTQSLDALAAFALAQVSTRNRSLEHGLLHCHANLPCSHPTAFLPWQLKGADISKGGWQADADHEAAYLPDLSSAGTPTQKHPWNFVFICSKIL